MASSSNSHSADHRLSFTLCFANLPDTQRKAILNAANSYMSGLEASSAALDLRMTQAASIGSALTVLAVGAVIGDPSKFKALSTQEAILVFVGAGFFAAAASLAIAGLLYKGLHRPGYSVDFWEEAFLFKQNTNATDEHFQVRADIAQLSDIQLRTNENMQVLLGRKLILRCTGYALLGGIACLVLCLVAAAGRIFFS